MARHHRLAARRTPRGGLPVTTLLTASNLAVSFGATHALVNADLCVDAGEIVAVMGPSGSGKSTLLHCAAGILRTDAGSVRYRDTELTTMSNRSRSALRLAEFGFVFQFGQLIPELTCGENVALPLRLNGMPHRRAAAVAESWLERLGVVDVSGQRPGEVSGGQAQRIAVARALAGEPRVIFADEPTGALDSLQGEQVMQLLVAAVRDSGSALILVTHESRLAAYSDREVLVRDGRTADNAAAA
ncbi:ABC transporter ATP-binding protein [Nakamurella sp. GG22]